MPSTRCQAGRSPLGRLASTLACAPAWLSVALVVAGCGVLPLHTMNPRPGQQVAAPLPARAASRSADSNLDTLTNANGASAIATPVAAGPAAALASATQPRNEPGYLLDSGDRLRIVVFGQEGLSNSYAVDAAGNITVPLIGMVPARGISTAELARAVAARLRNGFVREPQVAIEIEVYRPFFILGEVAYPGQYPYVPSMTVEAAVAIAGGFTPRAYRFDVKLVRKAAGHAYRASVPLGYAVRPGDTITVEERWF
jgi:polysaccharide export outer membrane protein